MTIAPKHPHELAQLSPADALKYALAMIAERDQAIAVKDQEIAVKDQTIAHKTAEIVHKSAVILHAEAKIKALTFELAYKNRMLFAAKRESFNAEQRDLFEETHAIDLAAIAAELDAEHDRLRAAQSHPSPKAPRVGAGRQALPEHLPRILHRHEPESCVCRQCQSDLVKIGEDINEQLDVEPAKFFVHRHIRPQYACKQCETITAAPIPAAVIDGGMAATGLLAWLTIGKYADHLPLYRLEQIAARDGVPLAKSTLSDWIGRVGVALQPLADRLSELLLARSVLHADETPVQQLAPGEGKSKKAYLWAYRTGDLASSTQQTPRIVVFRYHASRSGECARQFLAGWTGALMVDDYGGYKKLFSELGVTELGCLAHARRKFYDLYAVNQSPIAAEALARIAALYVIERDCAAYTIEDRFNYRQAHAAAKLKELHQWLLEIRMVTAPNTGTSKALDYSLKRWSALARYIESGEYPIDNNPIENSIRPIAIGKKNWLFAGSERAGVRAAAIQSLIATAKLNGIDPAKWLTETLTKLPTHPNSRIDELLPLRR